MTIMAESVKPGVPEAVKPLIEARDLVKRFRAGGSFGHGHDVIAVKNVSLSVYPGEAFGLVGESGSGKTTLGRMLLRLEEPTSGQILYDGKDITHLHGSELRQLRSAIQIVFQDPYQALNPWMSIRQAISEPLKLFRGLKGVELERELAKLLEMVGLPASSQKRLPREFSGGQRQRICLARALALKPSLLVLDEPTSALDVSVQAQIINLLRELQRELNLTYVFISHDLAVVGQVCDRVGIMRYGELLEITTRDQFITAPTNAYSRTLRDAVPEVGKLLPLMQAQEEA
jgi:ABC-type oligopeptide transport system ATPase subunit